eukprot:CAMPEP_0115236214 /NCGR_PEP_ID=MMETSP0270-20121206/35732_1 /TAXON_ID=71861 /ORGANISM="Scrippsiella trochoidea, Strain CCMP3099" /LENGTH=110 /DNA_ID=CAMNT_0002651063 /DNA_START=81 /DNA_END=413 /DNA_ORIENTATION=+
MLHTSAAMPSYVLSMSISGAANGMVPQAELHFCSPDCILANSKPPSFTAMLPSSSLMVKFSGLMSRWQTKAPCKCATASHSCFMSDATEAPGRGSRPPSRDGLSRSLSLA